MVMTPFCVPGGISNCSSGTDTVAALDLTTCRRSRSCRPFATFKIRYQYHTQE